MFQAGRHLQTDKVLCFAAPLTLLAHVGQLRPTVRRK
jgi:hypothetical protein